LSDRSLPNWPRGLREELAAEYVGLAPSTFRREVTERRAPQPIRLTPGRLVWLKEDLDAWLDRVAGRSTASPRKNPWMARADGTG
jgi:prophage regulatory protein